MPFIFHTHKKCIIFSLSTALVHRNVELYNFGKHRIVRPTQIRMTWFHRKPSQTNTDKMCRLALLSVLCLIAVQLCVRGIAAEISADELPVRPSSSYFRFGTGYLVEGRREGDAKWGKVIDFFGADKERTKALSTDF